MNLLQVIRDLRGEVQRLEARIPQESESMQGDKEKSERLAIAAKKQALGHVTI